MRGLVAVAAVLGLVTAAAGCHRRGPPPPAPDDTATGPRLVVLIVIDQHDAPSADTELVPAHPDRR